MKKLNSHGDGLYHDVPLAVVEEDAGHDVTGHLGMGRIPPARGTETVREAGLKQGDERVGMVLDGAGLPDGGDHARDADLHQALVVVTCQKLRLVGNFLKYEMKTLKHESYGIWSPLPELFSILR